MSIFRFQKTKNVNYAGFEILHLTEQALVVIRQEMENHNGIETGGPLVGFIEGEKVVVTNAAGPGPNGICKKDSVIIDGKYATDFCFKYQQSSNGSLYYVGDWHVHPINFLYLSKKDIKSAITMLNDNVCIVPYFLSVIFYKQYIKSYRIDKKRHIKELITHII